MYSQNLLIKIIFLFLFYFCLQLIFTAYENLLQTNLTRSVWPALLFISSFYKSRKKNISLTMAMTIKRINDVSCKDSTISIFYDFSDVNPITQRELKSSGLDWSDYFTTLEMERKIKSKMTLVTAFSRQHCITLFGKFLTLASTLENLWMQWILQFQQWSTPWWLTQLTWREFRNDE